MQQIPGWLVRVFKNTLRQIHGQGAGQLDALEAAKDATTLGPP
jgi:hypothetical protein